MRALATIVAGLAVHLGLRDALPHAAHDVIGDALWAAMLFWWTSALVGARPRAVRAAIAYAGCVAVETSQLLHTPWLDAARATLPGRLVLGSDFDVRDLIAYACGVVAAAVLDALLDAMAVRAARTAP